MTTPVSSRPVGQDTGHDDLGPGLHVLRDAAPLARAGQMAARLRAELCTTSEEVDVAIAVRRDRPVIDVVALDELILLAARVAIAERIALRTTEQAAAEVMERMAEIGAGVAVHPTTIRERAAAVEQARVGLVQAEQLLDAHDASAITEDAPAPAPAPAVPPPDLSAPVAPRRGFLWFRRRERGQPARDTVESTDLLRSIAAATDDAFGARRAIAARGDQRSLLVVRRESAAEVVRVAEHAWFDIAGEGTDPANVEEVVRRLDPQHQDAVAAAREMVSVRAASTVFDTAMVRWESAWAELGLAAPLASEAEAAVARLGEQVTNAVVLVGGAAERGLELVEVTPTAVVVVVESLLPTDP